MDNLYCVGGENNLTDCRFDGWGINDCEESEAAGVVCKPGPVSRLHSTQLTTTTTTTTEATTTTTEKMTTTPSPIKDEAVTEVTDLSSSQQPVTKRLQQDMAPAMRIKVKRKINTISSPM